MRIPKKIRRFGGKTYMYIAATIGGGQKHAQEEADTYRRKGFMARVVMDSDGRGARIYIRKKRK